MSRDIFSKFKIRCQSEGLTGCNVVKTTTCESEGADIFPHSVPHTYPFSVLCKVIKIVLSNVLKSNISGYRRRSGLYIYSHML